MKIASFDEVLKSLNRLDPWLRSLGMEPKSDRWHPAIQRVEKAKKQRESVERGGRRAPINNYMDGIFEALEIHEIVEAFSGDSSPTPSRRSLCAPCVAPSRHSMNSRKTARLAT